MVGPYPAAGGSGVSCVILRNIVSSSHASVEQSVIDRDHDSSTRRGVRGGTYLQYGISNIPTDRVCNVVGKVLYSTYSTVPHVST